MGFDDSHSVVALVGMDGFRLLAAVDIDGEVHQQRDPNVVASDSFTAGDTAPWTETTTVAGIADARQAVTEPKDQPGQDVLIATDDPSWRSWRWRSPTPSSALALFLSAFATTDFQALRFPPAFMLPRWFLLAGLGVPRLVAEHDLDGGAPVIDTPTTFMLVIALGWLAIGLALSLLMGRRGHDSFSWLIVGTAMGPVAVVMALESWRHGEALRREVLSEPGANTGEVDALVGFDGSAESRSALNTVMGAARA